MGPGASDIAGICPEIRQKLPDIEPAKPLNDPLEDRFRLFDSIRSFFQSSSKREPFLLILDNLQWCDKTSLQLLEFLAQELPSYRLLVMGIYRNVGIGREHPLFNTLGELSRQPSFSQMILHGFGQDEVAQVIRSKTIVEPSTTLVKAMYDRTEGNPLFIVHMLHALADDDCLVVQAQEEAFTRIDSVPETLQGVISRNLQRLSPKCHTIMKTTSVVGRQFSIQLLKRIFKYASLSRLFRLLEEAVRAGVVTEIKSEPGCFQFAHVLVRDALSNELSVIQKARIHARIGKALEDAYGPDKPLHAPQLAHHFMMAAEEIGPNKAIRYSRLAGERALTIFAYEEAASHFQRALEIKQKETPATIHGIPDDETAEILFSRSKAEAAVFSFGDPHTPAETIAKLLDYYIAKKDVTRVLQIAQVPMFAGDNASITESKARFERVIDLVDPGSREAGWVLCLYGYFLGTYGRDENSAQKALEQSVVIARRNLDQNLEMRALLNLVQVNAVYWKTDWDRVLPAIEMAQRLGDLQAECIGRLFAFVFATNTQSFTETQTLWEHAKAIADRLRYRSLQENITALGQGIALLQGDFQLSRVRSEHAAQGTRCTIASLMLRALTEYELGEVVEGDKFAQQAVEDLNRISNPFNEYGWASAQFPFFDYLTGRETWSEPADKCINFGVQNIPENIYNGILARVGIALKAIQHGDIEAARRSYDFLKGPLKAYQTRRMILNIAMSSDRLLGLLCLAFGDISQATDHFEEAIEICREKGFLPQLAWSNYDYARALFQRQQPGDRKRAASLLAGALTTANKLSMILLANRINAVLKSRVSPNILADNPYGLSDREIEVLKLLAEGKTNREIAWQLYVSPNTVATHVQNILSKGNLANRTEAAAFAARNYPIDS
jgi:DNA-binding CsgD family transcriptional regulator